MRFHLVINMERMDASSSYSEVARHVTEMVQIAEDAGFHMVWAAEHHGIEMTIAPDAFQILTWLAAHTSRIRLGTAVVVSPYAHPVRVAGQAALLDVYSDGRLDLGLGSGAYQWEMDRMKPGLKQQDAHLYTQELLPAVRALWEGDYSHEGEYWQFARMTSVPKPVQVSSPPVWIAARAPVTFDFAVKNNCNIMSWALARPFLRSSFTKSASRPRLKTIQVCLARSSPLCDRLPFMRRLQTLILTLMPLFPKPRVLRISSRILLMSKRDFPNRWTSNQ